MKKRALSALVLAFGIFLCGCSVQAPSLTVAPPQVVEKNQNNYVESNEIDCQSNMLAWKSYDFFGSILNVVDGNGNGRTFRDVGGEFQLYGDKILYLKPTPLDIASLMEIDIKTGKQQQILSQVNQFALWNEKLICLEFTFDFVGSVFVLDMNSGEKQTVCEKADHFLLADDKLYVSCESDSFGEDIFEISLETYEKKRVATLAITEYPFSIMRSGDYLAYSGHNQVNLYNMVTGEHKIISISDDPQDQYGYHDVNFSCNSKHFLVSFQARSANGSIISEEESEANGLWIVDANTGEKEKISSERFSSVFLLEDNSFFATRMVGSNRELYQGSLSDGTLVKISR